MTIDPILKKRAEIAADELMANVKGLLAVMVSSEDGFEVAARVENAAQVTRLSAMASSLSALGALAGQESNLGDCDKVMVEAKDGMIVILQVRRLGYPMVLSAIASKSAVVGQLLYFAKQAALSIEAA